MQEKTLAVLFGGIGGFSAGATRTKVEYAGQVYKYRLLVAIDCDPLACQNHDLITGESTAKVMDLFSREQYISFHAQEPPEDWQEVTPGDLWVAFGYQVPNKVFLSPPCKGLSGLLPAKSAETEKYQALNLLTLRGLELTLSACDVYGGKVPEIIHFENVPRITSRGKIILAAIKNLLKKYGYAVDMNPSHNLGEVGELGQNRIRFQIMARQENKIPNFIYLPPKKPLRTIGDVIGPLPSPGDTAACGWLHRLPQLQWKTWVRLALIRAGGDWRDLNELEWQNYGITYVPRGGGAYGVQSWKRPSRTITARAKVNGSSGCAAIADPRTNYKNDTHASIYRVCCFDQVGPTITGAIGPTNGCISISDPRLMQRNGRHPGVYKVVRIDESSLCITRTRFGSGALAVADPRISNRPGRYTDKYRIQQWKKTGNTVTGVTDIQSGAQVIADPRLSCTPRSGSYGVQAWNQTSKTVTGSGDIHSGTAAVADPRLPEDTDRGVWIIISEDGTWHRPLTTYELAMLQSFSTHLPDGRPFQIEGCSDAKAREYIGNAYPPDAAEAVCMSTLMALAKADEKVEFELSMDTIWVSPTTQDGEEKTVIA
ncbi:Phage protein [Desulfosporosinus sp. I2]|uniref:DNA cytosine methyltransferase n=1 Tax=Desulfosporosinus sp. I2 TaxID=1617025 RepID=UPI0005EFFA2C|nr:DNA cytosine methyltransferase [Desulfosporosinus sp. I2]KJR47379.1 Phage protein [Desulfosporosinus sp. I2]